MSDLSDQGKLHQEIIKLSQADNWEEARQEWELVRVEYIDEGYCLCGKRIKEHCFIFNETTDIEVYVGNECINHFDGVVAQAGHTKEIFTAIKRLTTEPFKHPGGHLASLAIRHGWVRPKEVNFLLTTEGRRSFSPAQGMWIADINKRIAQKLASEPHKYTPKPKRRSTTDRL